MSTAEIGASLLHALAQVPDPRALRGRHPLAAILALAVAAMLADARNLYAIAQWGRLQSAETMRALGITRAKTPSVSTLHEVFHAAFKAVDVSAFDAVLAGWAHDALAPNSQAIALDGKALRGIHGEELPGVRLVAAYDMETGLVLVQQGGRMASGTASGTASETSGLPLADQPTCSEAAAAAADASVVEADAAHQAELTLAP